MTARWSLWLALAGAVVCGYGIVTSGVGRAAERPGPHVIVLFAPLPTHEQMAAEDNRPRSIFTLSVPFADRAACERQRRRLVVMVAGGRVVCLPAEVGR